MSLRSLYERRFRRRDDHGKEPIINEDGNPRLVVARGQLIGVRATDGSVIPLPERRVEELDDTEWHWIAGEWKER